MSGQPGSGTEITTIILMPRNRKDKDEATLSLLLVDDHALFREGLIALLSYDDDLKVAGKAEDAKRTLKQARALQPDVVVMEIVDASLKAIQTHSLQFVYSRVVQVG